MAATSNIVSTIIDILSLIRKPISASEISFRARESQSVINESLMRLKEAKVIIEESDHTFQLNRDRQDYKLESMVSSK